MEEIDQEGLGCLLQCTDSLALPSKRLFGGVRQGNCDFADLDNRAQSVANCNGRNEGTTLTTRWNGVFRRRSSVDFWYLRISRRAIVPGL
jgi:hypothetical protein